LDNILNLNPVEYNWRYENYPEKNFDEYKHRGFLAQELMKVLPQSVIKDENNEYAVDYFSIIPTLTQAIKEQQKQIEELKEIIKATQRTTEGYVPTKDGYLEQNTPNPFSTNTKIGYELPSGTQKASIGVYDLTGKEIKMFLLTLDKKGYVSILGGDLSPGIYLYSLIIDGRYFDSKKMILTSN
jgi:hypothetical protein